jgi:serine/threonine protein phosphatase 1
VGLGDYIDRGPDSKGAVDALLAQVPANWDKVFLKGNHEQAMLDFLEEPDVRGEWLAWGGIQALESYGVAPYGARGLREPAALAAEFEHALAEAGHKAFFRQTRLMHLVGNYMFVHAGVRRGIGAEQQMANDLLFIREDFIGKPHDLPYRVVFGHTILDVPLMEEDRIGLDTGAFQSGILSAVRLEGVEAQIIRAGQPESII